MGSCSSSKNNKSEIITVKPKPILSHSGYITNLVVLSNGKVLSNSTTDERIIMYDYNSGKLKAIEAFTGHEAISTPLLEYKGSLLSGDYHGNLLIWSLTDFTLKDTIKIYISSISKLNLLSDGRILAFFSNDKFKILDPLNNYAECTNLNSILDQAKFVKQSPYNDLLAIYYNHKEHEIKFIDINQDKVVNTIDKKYVMYFSFKKNGNMLAVGLSNVWEYDKDSFQLVKSADVKLSGNFLEFLELNNGNFIGNNLKGQCLVFNSNYEQIFTIEPVKESEDFYSCRILQMSDGNILVSDFFGNIRVFNEDYKLISIVEASKV
jgi:WD40 repeat protein